MRRNISKKMIMMISSALLLSSIFSTGSSSLVHAEGAIQESQIRMGTIDASYKVKDNITLPVLALNTSELMGVEFSVTYDPKVLDFIADETELSSGFYTVDENSNISIDEQNGVLKYALIKNQIPRKETIPQIKIAHLHFEALQAAETTSIKLEDILATTGYVRISTNPQDMKQVKISTGNDSGNVDTTKPVITVESGNSVNSPAYILKGTVTDNDPNVSLTVNGTVVPLNNHTFSKSYTLTEGENRFDLVAMDGSGNKQEYTFVVTYTKPGNGGGDNGGGDNGGGNNGGGSNGGGNSGSIPGTEASEPESVSVPIVAAAGGTVKLGSKFEMVIPANALKADATITVRRLADHNKINELLPQGLVLKSGSEIYEVTTTGDKNFEKRVTVTLTLDKLKIKDGKKPAVYYYHEARKQWIYLGGQVNTAGEISVEVDHLTKFAVFTDETLVTLNDVNGHWALAFIDRLVGMKVISGYEDQTFRPENNVTRAEFTTMMVSALGLASENKSSLSFADTDQIPDWAHGYVKAAVDAGIIEGRPGANDTTIFDAGALITRAEMAVMITRAMRATTSAHSLHFADAGDIPDWAKSSIELLAEKAIINGFEDNTFRPDTHATRAQAATMIFKLLDELGI